MSASRMPGARVIQRVNHGQDKPQIVEVVSVSQADWLPRSPLSGLHGIVRPCDGGLLFIHEYALQAEHLVMDPSRYGWASYLLVTSLVPQQFCWLDGLVAVWTAWIEPERDRWRYPLFAQV